jgi:hypothetical protein
MPDLKPEFTKQELETLERMKKACAKPNRKSFQIMQNCTILKAQQLNEYERKQAEIRAIALANLSHRRLQALTYVIAKMNSIQTEGLLLSNALQKASGEYDMILASRAEKPIAGEIAFTLFLAVLPELKIVGRAIRTFAPGGTNANWRKLTTAASSSKASSWEQLADEVNGKMQKTIANNARLVSFGQFLDKQSKDIIEAIKNPLGAKANVDAETQKRLGAFNAKNQMLTAVIKAVERKLVLVNKFEPILYSFVLWYEGEDILTFLAFLFGVIGFDENLAYDAKSFDLFADLILYDMLRAYAKQYAVAWINMAAAGAKFEDIIGKSYAIDGLDEAQKRMVYNKFGAKVWKSRMGYHSLDDSRDLIRHLGVRTVSNLDDKEVNLLNPFS